MVVGHLNPRDAIVFPAEDDPPLVVDPDSVKPLAITLERFEPVPGRHRQIAKPRGSVQVLQSALGRPPEFRREPSRRRRPPIMKEVVGQPVPKGPDHRPMLPYFDNTRSLTGGLAEAGAVAGTRAALRAGAGAIRRPSTCFWISRRLYAIDTESVRTYHVYMNITLSVDERIVRRARKKATALGKSLNQLVREYLERLAGSDDAERDVAEVRQLSRESRGRARGWRFDRNELHERA